MIFAWLIGELKNPYIGIAGIGLKSVWICGNLYQTVNSGIVNGQPLLLVL